MSEQTWVFQDPEPQEQVGKPLQLLTLSGIFIETVGCVLQQLGGSGRVLAQEFYLAALHVRQVREARVDRAIMAAELDEIVNGDQQS